MIRATFLLLLVGCQSTLTDISLLPLETKTNSLLQAISIVDEEIAWVSGHDATMLRTINGGRSWTVFHHKSDTLQFRDVHAFDENRVVLMSSGPGNASGIYCFTLADGWKQTYVMPYPEGFLNSIEFWDDQKGLAYGDSFDRQLFVLQTMDGGMSWERVDPKKLPVAGENEGGFASSGTSISTLPGGEAWIGTGGGGHARILYTRDYGDTWSAQETPMIKGAMGGIFSIRMITSKIGTITGGDLGTELPNNHLAITKDGGQSWSLASPPQTTGTFYGSDLLQAGDQLLWIICGPNGMDYSLNAGKSWENSTMANYWAVDLSEDGFGYAVGTNGKIARITIVKD